MTRAKARGAAIPLPEQTAKRSGRGGAASSEIARNSSGERRDLFVQSLDEIRSRQQRFLWTDRIPLGTLTLLAGRGGVGKSTFAMHIAAEAQRGELEGDFLGEPTSVIFLSAEDDWATQLKPRFMAARAVLGLTFKASIHWEVDDQTGESYPTFPSDIPLIRRAIEETGARLVIIDPLTSAIDGDDHKRNVVRAVLDPLAQLAREMDVAIVGIMHFNKGAGVASDKLSGSHAFRDAARSVLIFMVDEDSGDVVVSNDKANYARSGDSFSYRLTEVAVDLDDGYVAKVAKVTMLGKSVVSVQDLLNRAPAESAVVAWLSEYIRMHPDGVDAREAEADGLSEGHSKSALTRARKAVRPPIISIKTGMNGGWRWMTEGVVADHEEIPERSEETASASSDAFVISSLTRSRRTPPRKRARDPSA